LGEYLTLNGEVGSSNHFTGNGLAYKVETAVNPISEINLKGYYKTLPILINR
jgi:hypothetical protein